MARPSKLASSLAALGACVAVSGAASPARAEGTNEAAAEALFIEAKALMLDGKDGAACPKLAESQRLDPGTGTLLMLALCDERIGRTASAWEEYREALARAERERRPDRADLARRHVASLEPKLVRVRVRLTDEDASLPGFELRRDGEPMAATTWLAPVPVDPGEHVFEAFALGERRWSATTTVGTEPSEQEILVPKLRLPPPLLASPIAIPPREHEPRHVARREPVDGLRLGAYGAVVVAVAGVVVGSIYGVLAIEDRRDAERLCPAYPCATGAASANEAAKASAVISNIAFAAGGAGAVGALVLILADHPAPAGTGGGTSPATRSFAGLTLGWQGRW